jgi:hypothetical protein
MLERNDILWILDLVTTIEQDLQSFNERLSSFESIYHSDRKHITNILQSNSNILDDLEDDFTGTSLYVSNLSKKIVSLEELSKSKGIKRKSNYD